MDHNDLRSALQTQVRAFSGSIGGRNIPGGWLFQALVLRQGIVCNAQPLPDKYRRALPKQCFRNAADLVRKRRNLSYCEGYVAHHNLPFPIHHAWAIDSYNRVIDNTLAEPFAHVYMGVAFTRKEYFAVKTRSSSSLFLDVLDRVNARLVLTLCPELKEFLPRGALSAAGIP